MYGPLLLLTTLLTTTCSLDNTTLVTLTTPRSKLLRNETSTLTLQLNEVVKQDLLFNCTPSSQNLLTIYGGQQITVSYVLLVLSLKRFIFIDNYRYNYNS